MKLVMVGTGYVGLVSGLCFAEFGFETICVDKDIDRIENIKKGQCPFYEPGLENLLIRHINETKLLSFNTSLKNSMKDADIIFITVGTPSRRLEDDADLSSVYKVAEEIADNISNYCLIVTKSTVPVGTTKQVKKIISSKVDQDKFDIVSNPEFLREGSAINDFLRPDRIVIGCDNLKSEKLMRELYRPLYLLETPIIFTNIESAEIIKYASNSFLATKISFINQIADLCENVGGNVQDVAKAMGLDKRIGSKFLHAGPGFGGSCFPKDVKAFSSTAKKFNTDLSIIEAVNEYNQERPKQIVKKIEEKFDDNLGGITLAILGLSFKPNTDDVRDSTSLAIAKLLKEKGANIKVYDPKAMKNSKNILTNLIYSKSVNDACTDVDAIIIATEWNEFRALNFKEIKKIIKRATIFDLRNIYNKDDLENLDFEYYGIGK